VVEAEDWEEGVYLGATLGSETTAAITGKVGVVRSDPMAMIAFCGYHMGDYFAHWLKIGKVVKHAPRIFRVNWFRKDANGKFLWPGFSDNMRVLSWIVERCHGRAQAQSSPLGLMPRFEDLTWSGLENLGSEKFAELSQIDVAAWAEELRAHETLFRRIGPRLPGELERLRNRLGSTLTAHP